MRPPRSPKSSQTSRFALLKRARRIRASRKFIQNTLRYHQQRDEAQRAATYLLQAEGANYSRLWLAEVFTPVDIPKLQRQLEDLTHEVGDSDDYGKWFRESRDASVNAWHSLPNYVASADGIPFKRLIRKLPEGVERVSGGLTLATPSTAVLVLCFTYTPEFSKQYGALTRQRESTSARRLPNGGHQIFDVTRNKRRKVEQWNNKRVTDASSWMSKNFTGFFAREGRTPPSIALVSTVGFQAWDREAPPAARAAYGILGLASQAHESYWTCDEYASLRAREMETIFTNVEDGLLLSIPENDLNPTAPTANSNALSYLLENGVQTLAVRWALSRMAKSATRRLNRLRDEVASIADRATSKKFLALRDKIVALGVDTRLAIAESADLADDARLWHFDLPGFSEVVAELHPKGYVAQPLDEFWRYSLVQRSQRLESIEREFRDIAPLAADFTNLAFGIRTQRAVLWLTVASVAVAAVSLVVAVVALQASNGPSTGPMPTTSQAASSRASQR